MKYILRRLVFYVVAAWAAITINFFLPRAMPGNPAEAAMANAGISAKAYPAIEAMLGVGKNIGSLPVQYWHYLIDLLHLNFGVSTQNFPSTAASVVGPALPWTLILVGTSTVIAFAIGTTIGIVAAWRRGGWLDATLPALTFFQAVPYFFLALILIDVFGVHLGWFPAEGGFNLGVIEGWHWNFIFDAIDHSLLPAFTLAVTAVAGWAVGMRNFMTTTIGEEYVLAGQAKGLSSSRVVLSYAARNAILPNIAGFANALGLVVSGALIMEYVFSYPGVGYTLYIAITADNYPVAQMIFLVIALAVLAANFIADLVYVVLDPRTRREAAH